MENELLVQTDVEIINEIIGAWGLEFRIFPFVKQKSLINTKLDQLPKILNNSMLIKKINDLTVDLNTKEKGEFIDELLISPRLIMQKKGELSATINIKYLNVMVDSILTKHDFSYMKKVKATKLFYLLYVLETNALIQFFEINSIDHKTIITPDIYIQSAVIALQMFLSRDGDAEISFAFDYFFNKFSYSFNFLDGRLPQKRMVLISRLLQVYGTYSNSPISLHPVAVE